MGLFSSEPAWDPLTQIPNLTGKVALITGGYGGLGFVTAEHLALNGARVWIAGRSKDKANAAMEKYKSTHAQVKDKGEVSWLSLDLSSIKEVQNSAQAFCKLETRLDILVNNAARLWSPYILGEDGLELSVATNHIGHFTLVQELMPLLKHTTSLPSTSVRVVTVSSGAHKFISTVEIDSKASLNTSFAKDLATQDAPGLGGPMSKRYFHSKLLNILFASELQRRADAQGINLISLSVDPGITLVDGMDMQHMQWWLRLLFHLIPGSPVQGATATLFASSAAEVGEEKKYRGAYLGPGGKLMLPSKIAQDEVLARKLWEVSEDNLAEVLKS